MRTGGFEAIGDELNVVILRYDKNESSFDNATIASIDEII